MFRISPREISLPIATITLCRPTPGVGDSNPKCSTPEMGNNDMKYGSHMSHISFLFLVK